MFSEKNGSLVLREAPGSTLRGAFSHLPVLLAGFGEAHSQRISFGLICLLFSVES
jgi:hypothetical protein